MQCMVYYVTSNDGADVGPNADACVYNILLGSGRCYSNTEMHGEFDICWSVCVDLQTTPK